MYGSPKPRVRPVASCPKRKLIDSNHQFSEQTAIDSGSPWLFKMFCSSIPYFFWIGPMFSDLVLLHITNVTTTARKPCDINRFGADHHPLWSTRPSHWFFSIIMSNYIHAITCIIIYMGILLMQIQNTQPLNHSSQKKTPSPPNHSKKKHPQDVFSNHHQKITESVLFRPVGSRADLVEVLSQKATQSYHKHLAGLEGGCYL